MKVSPEYFIQLSHRVNTLHKEKEKFIESPGEKDRKVIGSPSEKGQRKHCKPGSKDRVDIFICICSSCECPARDLGVPGRGTGLFRQPVLTTFLAR